MSNTPQKRVPKLHLSINNIGKGNDIDNDNEIDLFRHHNGNNTNIKVI